MTGQKSHVSSHQGLCVANGMGWMWGRAGGGGWVVMSRVVTRVCVMTIVWIVYSLTGRYMGAVCPMCDGWYGNYVREGNSSSDIVVSSENDSERIKSGGA
jgi:hypothetical protein